MSLAHLPQELKVHVARMVYLLAQPSSPADTLHVYSPDGRSIAARSREARRALWALSQVSRAWNAAARPYLLREVHVGLPYSFLLLLRTLGASHLLVAAYDTLGAPRTVNMDPTDPASFPRMVAAAGFAHAIGHRMVVALPDKDRRGKATHAPSFPLEPEHPPPFPVRGKLLPDDDGELELVWDELLSSELSEVTETETEATESDDTLAPPRRGRRYVVALKQDGTLRRLHRYVRLLDFSTFHTQGLKRTVGQGVVARFVTPSRLLAMITAVQENLTCFAASETMDSALTLPVLEALLLRPDPRSTESQDGPFYWPGPSDSSSPPRDERVPSRSRSRGRTFQRRPASLRGVSLESTPQRRSNSLSVRAELQDADPPMINKQLQALDLCGCVSSVFQAALDEFVQRHLTPAAPRSDKEHLAERRGRTRTRNFPLPDAVTEESGEESDVRASWSRPLARSSTYTPPARGVDPEHILQGPRAASMEWRSRSTSTSHPRLRRRSRSHSTSQGQPKEWTPLALPSVERLGLNGVRAPTESLHKFILAFPRLTHLDLSGTLVTDNLLASLTATPLSLAALGLAECKLLSSRAITDLLVSPVCASLRQLSLRRTTDGPVLTRNDATQLFSASFFKSGDLEYLDLGGCGLDDTLLSLLPPQPHLLDLGLSYNPNLSLSGVSSWVLRCARAVEVLDLTSSCDAASHGPVTASTLYAVLLGPLAESGQPSLTEQLTGTEARPRAAKTNLRVVELSPRVLYSVGGGIGAWHAIRGAGRRGWVVDTLAVANTAQCADGVPPAAAAELLGRHAHGDDDPGAVRELRPVNNDLVISQPKPPFAPTAPGPPPPRTCVLRSVPGPQADELQALAESDFNLAWVGWHAHKMTVVRPGGFLGREEGAYAHVAYARP